MIQENIYSKIAFVSRAAPKAVASGAAWNQKWEADSVEMEFSLGIVPE